MGAIPLEITWADFNNDGLPDLAVCNSGESSVSILKNTSSAETLSFDPKTDFITASYPNSVKAADYDGDGKVDLIAGATGFISLLKNTSANGSISLSTKTDYTVSGTIASLITSDWNNDGKPDIALHNSNNSTYTFLRNQVSEPTLTAYQLVSNATTHNVILTGTNLATTKSVKVANTEVKSFTVISDTEIQALVGENTAGSITLVTNYGSTSLAFFSNVPVPSITAVFPEKAAIGSSVTITGKNFNNVAGENIVYFGAVKAEIVSGNKDSVVVKVPKGATFAPITLTAYGLTSSSKVLFSTTFQGLGSAFNPVIFQTKKDYSITNNYTPRDAATADFNNDGKPDLAVTLPNQNYISVIKNVNNDFSTANAISLATGSSPKKVSTADIDGDGLLDIVVGYFNSYMVSLYRNTSSNGTISFTSKIDLSIASNASDIVISDLNNDGKPDIAVINGYSTQVSIFRNQGSPGNISFAARFEIATGSSPVAIVASDLNDDNKPELIVANNGSSSISVFKNVSTNSQIGFENRIDQPTGSYPTGLAIADIDGDNKTDILISNTNSNFISILKNTSGSAISFGNRTDFLSPANCDIIRASDIDGDGKVDIALGSSSYYNFSLYKNISTGGIISLAPKVDYNPGTYLNNLNLADLTDDGKPDLIVTNASGTGLSIYTNRVHEPYLTAYALTTNANYNTSLTGGNFKNASAVTFNGKAAVSFTVTTDNTVNAMAPANTIGEIKVTTPFGTASLSGFSNFPPPVISSFTPSTGETGSTVVISGANFGIGISDNHVYFGNIKAVISSASSTSLTVKVPVGASYGPIKVTANQLTGSSAGNFGPTFAGGSATFNTNSFAPKADVASLNYYPNDVASADFDGDGKLDLASISSSYLYIFKNSGSSGTPLSSNPTLSIAVGSSNRALSIADFDGDSMLDIAIINNGNYSISIFRNTSTSGTISFASKVEYPVGSSASDIVSADFDMDGKTDLSVVNNSGNYFYVFRNTGGSGNISFATKTEFTLPYYNSINSLAATDLDLDGKTDLILSIDGISYIQVYKNTTTSSVISFAAKAEFPVGSSPTGIAVADFDLDGKNDLAVANKYSNSVSVLKNNSTSGSIIFATKTDLGIESSSLSVIADDFNGDGKADIALTNNAQSRLSIFANKGNKSIAFNPKVDYATGTAPVVLIAADLTGDSKPDLISCGNTSTGSIALLKNQVTDPILFSYRLSPANTSENVTLTGANLATATALTFNGKAPTSFKVVSDTTITALVPENTAGAISVTTLYGTAILNGFSNIAPPVISSFSPESGNAGTSVTINGSNFAASVAGNAVYFGSVKATVTAATSNSITVTVPAGATYKPISVASNNLTAYSSKPFVVTFSYDNPLFPNNAFALPTTAGNVYYPTGSSLVDLNEDGKADLVVIDDSYYLRIFLNNGSATTPFGTSPNISLSSNYGISSVNFGDIDSDGKEDIVIAHSSINTISLYRNTTANSVLSFAPKSDLTTSGILKNPLFADVDLDGRPDLICVNNGMSAVSVLSNQSYTGSFIFNRQANYGVSSNPAKITVMDFDGDGYPDIAASNNYSSSISVLLNSKTNGTFKPKSDFTVGSGPWGLAAGDINADGKVDIVACNNSSNTISVLKNTSTPGSLSFASKTDYGTGSSPASVTITDLNGDGLPDLTVSNSSSSTISVFKNNSLNNSIAFSSKADYQVNASVELAIADLTGDSKPDIIGHGNYNRVQFLQNTVTKAPVITSFSPAVICRSSSVTITGVNLSNISSVVIGGYEATFTLNSPTSITATPSQNVYTTSNSSISVTNNEGIYTTAGLTITSTPIIDYYGYTVIKKGTSLTLNTSSSGSLQWYKDGIAISGANSYSYATTESGSYTVSNGSCQSTAVSLTFVSPASIQVAGNNPTCRGSLNGMIKVTASSPGSYWFEIYRGGSFVANGNFTTSYTKTNLSPGAYSIYVSLNPSGELLGTYVLDIKDPAELSVYSSIDPDTENLDLVLDGAGSYIIKFNGETIKTSEKFVSLKLNKGENNLSVITENACQGSYERTFVLNNRALVYPNPFDKLLQINLGINSSTEAEIKIYNLAGQLVHSGNYACINNVVSADLSHLSNGTYILRYSSGKIINSQRIIKQ